MIGKIFITSSGYDPELGRHVKDPYLGDVPSLGACRPDIRRQVRVGDYIFTLSGKVRAARQYLLGGFEVDSKIPAIEAYRRFPERRLHRLGDGQLDGNIIVNSRGFQHRLDSHEGFDRRIQNYVVGRNALALASPSEIARGREETLDVLCKVFDRMARSPHELLGHYGKTLDAKQVSLLLMWLHGVKDGHR